MDPVEAQNAIVGEGLTIEEIKAMMPINVDDLQKECADQIYLYAQVGQMHSRARDASRRAWARYEMAKSIAAKEIRANPSGFGVEKVTEAAVNTAVANLDDIQGLYEECLNCDLRQDAANNLLQLVEHRKSMLNNEVQMLISRFYQERKGDVEEAEKKIAELRK